MNKKIKQIRRITAVILMVFGIGIIILTQVVKRNNLIEWQEPIRLVLWGYMALVFLYIIFLYAIPLVWDYFTKRTL